MTNTAQTMMRALFLWTTTVSIFGCEGPDRGTPALASPSGAAESQAHTDDAIVGDLATARCQREASCNNIGGGQKYASHEVCMDQMRGSLANDLNTYNCSAGIDRVALDHCMVAIKAEECSHPLDTMARVDKCRTGALCMK
jgi:hypothetical protein